MIKAGEFYQLARLLAGDLQQARFSDYEVYTAMNAAVDLLCRALARSFSPELTRRVELSPEGGRVLLPEDFFSVVDVAGVPASYEGEGWRIEGDWLICGEAVVTLVYRRHPGKVSKAEDAVDLAPCFLFYLGDIAAGLLRGEREAAEAKAQAAAEDSAPDKRGVLPEPVMWS